MTEKHIINFINNEFKDYKIKIFVDEKGINYLNPNDRWLGSFYLNTNKFVTNYYLTEHFKNIDEMNEFIKPILRKIIHKKINVIY